MFFKKRIPIILDKKYSINELKGISDYKDNELVTCMLDLLSKDGELKGIDFILSCSSQKKCVYAFSDIDRGEYLGNMGFLGDNIDILKNNFKTDEFKKYIKDNTLYLPYEYCGVKMERLEDDVLLFKWYIIDKETIINK